MQHLEAVNRGLQLVREELPEWRAFGWQEVNHRLRGLDDAMPGIRTIYITDARGTVLAADRAGLSGKNFSSREYFYVPRRQPDPKTLYISSPFKTLVTGIFGMNATLIISGPHGKFNGIITATLDPSYFSNILSSVLYAPDMWSSIVHSDGLQFLMIPQREDQAGINRAATGSFFTRHWQSGKPENVFTGIYFATSEKLMMALSTVNPARVTINKHLIVTVSRGIDSIYYDWRRSVKMQSALFGLMGISGIIGLYFYQRRQEIFYRREEESINALRDSEFRYRRIVDTSNEGIWVVGEDIITSFVNERMADMLGYPAEEMIGKPVSTFMFEEDVSDYHSRMGNRRRGLSEHYEGRYRHKNGQAVWTIASAVPIFDDEHHFKGSFAMFTDITEGKKIEDHLRQAQKMEAVGQLAGGIAHDFNNMLTAIIGYGSLLNTKLGKDSELRPFVDQILSSAGKSANLTRQLLAFSRKQEIMPTETDLNELIKGMEKLLLRLIGEDIELKAQLAEKSLTVMVDPGQIEQVLMNLSTNAQGCYA